MSIESQLGVKILTSSSSEPSLELNRTSEGKLLRETLDLEVYILDSVTVEQVPGVPKTSDELCSCVSRCFKFLALK